MQAGWAVLLGSFRGATVTTAYVFGMNFLGIPFEERLLHSTFRLTYDEYRDRVPRWI